MFEKFKNIFKKQEKENQLEKNSKWSDAVFQKPSNYESLMDKAMTQYSSGKITEKEFEVRRFELSEQCKFKDMINCPLKFARVVKSTDVIAENSSEKHKRIETKENAVCSVDNKKSHPLSFTTEDCLLSCIPYGDQIAYISFSENHLKKNNLMDETIFRRGFALNEHNARKLYIEKIKDLNDPEVLKDIIKKSRIEILVHEIEVDINGIDGLSTYLDKFGLVDTLNAWKNVTTAFNEIENMPAIEKAKTIQQNIEVIIPKLDIDEFILAFESNSETKNENDKNTSINKAESEYHEI